jgi:hypothetical protein
MRGSDGQRRSCGRSRTSSASRHSEFLGNCSMHCPTSCMAQASFSTGTRSHLLPAVVSVVAEHRDSDCPEWLVICPGLGMPHAFLHRHAIMTGNDNYNGNMEIDSVKPPGGNATMVE